MDDEELPSQWCLFLDVDGTLLELAARPADVHVDESLHELLARLESVLHGAIALVSGRPIVQLDRLFAPRRWPAAGLHGLERRDASGQMHRETTGVSALPGMLAELAAVVDRVPGAFVEDKGLAVAVHYRAAPHADDGLRSAVAAIAARFDGLFEVLEGKMVLEILPNGACKARAIREFLAEPPFRGRLPIFVGDDLTDRGALREVERYGGLSVVVGSAVPGMVKADSPGEVRRMLWQLAESGVLQ
jgi:trehalose 6-phosphate phosphatase